MSKVIRSRLQCPSCTSSDAYHIYDDGHGYCYSCKEYFSNNNIITTTSTYINLRGISKTTMKYYNTVAKVGEDGTPLALAFPYGEEGYKVRYLLEKKFSTIGNTKDVPIFGLSSFQAGQGKAITITEGELDAMSVYEMMGGYPAVSVRSSSSAKKDCATCFDYLNSFEKIYICFDNDIQGDKAAQEVASLFDMNKVYIVKLTKYNDPNEYLTNGESKAFAACWWNARKYMPRNVVASWQEVEALLNQEDQPIVCEYPFETLQSMTYGIREGEIVLLTAHEKVGKTEVLRALEYHVLKTTNHNIGIIHLEESEKRSIQGLVGYELEVPCHLPDSGVSSSDVFNTFKSISKRDGRVHFYTHFGSEDPQAILDTIRFLVTVRDCRVVTLDHITMIVTGLEDGEERKKLDWLSTKLAMMVRELGFSLILISHVNDEGKTRGSRNISKVADILVHLERDVEAASENERNLTYLQVRGNRYAGITGPAGVLRFDSNTFILKEYLPKDYEPEFETT